MNDRPRRPLAGDVRDKAVVPGLPYRGYGPPTSYGCQVIDDPKRPRFMTIEQVAEELAVGIPTVRQLLKSGELRGFQLGGRGYLAYRCQGS